MQDEKTKKIENAFDLKVFLEKNNNENIDVVIKNTGPELKKIETHKNAKSPKTKNGETTHGEDLLDDLLKLLNELSYQNDIKLDLNVLYKLAKICIDINLKTGHDFLNAFSSDIRNNNSVFALKKI